MDDGIVPYDTVAPSLPTDSNESQEATLHTSTSLASWHPLGLSAEELCQQASEPKPLTKASAPGNGLGPSPQVHAIRCLRAYRPGPMPRWISIPPYIPLKTKLLYILVRIVSMCNIIESSGIGSLTSVATAPGRHHRTEAKEA